MRLARTAFLALALCASVRAFAFDETFIVAPATPLVGQDFTVTISGLTGCIPVTITSAQVSGNRIDVRAHQGTEACLSPPGGYSVSHVMRVDTAGQYDLAYQVDAEAVTSLGKVTIAVANSAEALSGIWHDPAAPGSGISVSVGANGNLFLVWFTYRDHRPGQPYVSHRDEPSWFMVSGGTRVSPTEFRGTLHRTTSLQREQPYSVQALRVEAIGEAVLKVRADGKLEFTTTNSVTPPVTIVLQKYDF